jgi:hypothetical protein
MTQRLRLVLGAAHTDAPSDIELPPAGPAGLHIHLHLGPPAAYPAVEIPPSAPAPEPARSGRRIWRPVLTGLAGVLIAVVFFDLGARSGQGHAEAIAAAQLHNANMLARATAPQAALPNLPDPNAMPPAVTQQLAQPPTVTPPPGAPAQPGASNPFGLQP